jgi:branched-chain amino acid transport system ATP-binding protein
MTLLEIDNLCTGYGEIKVLWDVSLRIAEKGTTALLGANGAGKSTILNCIVGLQRVWSGDIRFEGSGITGIKANKRIDLGISMVPEGRRIFSGMTVMENLMMGAYTKRAREKMRESFEEVYQLFPVLKDRLSQRAGTLSGGEQQMLAVARALMSRPKLLMLDEPSLGLAPVLIKEIFQTIRTIADQGTTVLLVEQDVQHSLSLSNRGYVLEHGRIVMEGTGKELLSDPKIREAYLGI